MAPLIREERGGKWRKDCGGFPQRYNKIITAQRETWKGALLWACASLNTHVVSFSFSTDANGLKHIPTSTHSNNTNTFKVNFHSVFECSAVIASCWECFRYYFTCLNTRRLDCHVSQFILTPRHRACLSEHQQNLNICQALYWVCMWCSLYLLLSIPVSYKLQQKIHFKAKIPLNQENERNHWRYIIHRGVNVHHVLHYVMRATICLVGVEDDPPSCPLSRGEADSFKLWTVKVLTFKAFN